MKKLLLCIVTLFTITPLFAQGWGEIQKIVPDDRALGDEFGYSVAMQGEYAIISAREKSTTSSRNGAVYVFKQDGIGIWNQEQRLQQSTPRQFDEFGNALAIDGNYLIVGCRAQDYDENEANYINDAPGAAYVFEKDGSGNWSQAQKLVGTDRTSLDVFGDAVAISGNYAIVSAPWEDEDANDMNTLSLAGSAFIFERDAGGVWQRVQKIVASDREANMAFGEGAVAIDGNYIAIGVFREVEDATGGNPISGAGAVYMFERDGSGTWNEVQKIVASDREQGEWFGKSVSIDGDVLIVGASKEYPAGNVSFQDGAAYMFERDSNGVWNETQKISPSNGANTDRFGNSVAIEGNFAIVGAYLDDVETTSDCGTASVYEKDGNGVWNEVQYIYALVRANSDLFGFDVAISNGFAVVSAYQEDEDEIGANPLSSAGSAYIFDANEPNTLSIIENSFSSILRAYPNPTQDKVHIDLKTMYETIELEVLNVLGQVIINQTYNETSQVKLNLKNLHNGLYLVKLKTNTSFLQTIKIIKE